jgi:hypothetical protein
MLVAFRLAGLSGLGTHYASVAALTQTGRCAPHGRGLPAPADRRRPLQGPQRITPDMPRALRLASNRRPAASNACACWRWLSRMI